MMILLKINATHRQFGRNHPSKWSRYNTKQDKAEEFNKYFVNCIPSPPSIVVVQLVSKHWNSLSLFKGWNLKK